MLAVVTTDYPLEPGEAIELLRPAVDESFNSISVDGECSTNDAVVLLASGAAAIERTADTDAAFEHALHAVCADLARTDRRGRRGSDGRRRDHRHRRRRPRQARAIAQRIATSPLVKTALFGRDANWGRVLMAAGSAPLNGGYAPLDPARVSLTYNGTPVLVAGAPHGRRAARRRPDVLDRARPRARRRARELPHDRPLLRLRPHQRGLPIMSRRASSSKVGGAGRAAEVGRRAVARRCSPRRARRCASCTAPASRSPLEMERAGIPVRFVGGRRVTRPDAIEVVRRSFAQVGAALCAALGPSAVQLFGDEIGLEARPGPGARPGRRSAPLRPAGGARRARRRAASRSSHRSPSGR